MPIDTSSDYVAATGALAPVYAVTGMSMAGVTLQDWVYILTILYTLLQIGRMLWVYTRRYWNND